MAGLLFLAGLVLWLLLAGPGRAGHAAGAVALVFCVIGIAVMLVFSPAYKLEWATYFMIANLLVFALKWGWLCEYAVATIYY